MKVHNRWLAGSAAVALGIYALMWIGDVHNWAWLATFDASLLEPTHRFGTAHPGWITAWDVYCTVLGTATLRLAALVAIVVALVRRSFRLAMFLLITVELSALITQIAKVLADRARPDTAMVFAWGTSFPSGHALGIMVAVAALFAIVLPTVSGARRAWLIVLGAVAVFTIGIGRVVLNVHHPSDVIAGWALGYAYFAVCLLLLPPRAPVTHQDERPAALDTAR